MTTPPEPAKLPAIPMNESNATPPLLKRTVATRKRPVPQTPLSADPIFLELYKATLIGVCGQFKRNPARSLTVEEGLILQETEIAWRFAKRARELIAVEEAKARRLPPIVTADEFEEFNGLIETEETES